MANNKVQLSDGTDGADARRDRNRQEVVIVPQTDGMPVT